MRLTTSATALLLLASNALAGTSSRSAFKKLPGDTELSGCGDNSKLMPEFASIKLKDNGNATLTLIMNGSHVGKSTGSLYVYESSTQDVLEEVDFNLCSSFLVKGKCPLTGAAEGVLEFSTFGFDLWKLDIGVDVFSKNKQILCLYGQAAPFPKPGEALVEQQQQQDVRWEV